MKYILFDLDGTLLGMDQDEFTGYYFKLLAKKMAPYGYEPQEFIQAVWSGVKSMVVNTGEITNEEAFWKYFIGKYGEKAINDRAIFDEFYRENFKGARITCSQKPEAIKLINILKERGQKIALATNPLFPDIATLQRIDWAGFKPEDFDFISTYENSHYCKPNPNYFKEFLSRLGVEEEEYSDCLMVGNDINEDYLPAKSLGMKAFIITDNVINKDNMDMSDIPSGSFDDLLEFIDSI